jgi:glycine/D-amino acid oxidase-like deaminating enzyme
VGRPAPLLEHLAPGLLLATGHYRNGVLLAPASAEWVVEQVERA